MSMSANTNVFFLFQTLPKKKLSAITARRFFPHPASSNTRLLSLGLRCTAAGMSSVAPRGPSRAEAGSGGGFFEQAPWGSSEVEEPSMRGDGSSGGGRPAVAPGIRSSIIEGVAFIALVVFEYFVKIVASGIAFISLVVWMGYHFFVNIAVYGIGFIALVSWLGYQTFLTCLSKIGDVKRKGNLVQNIHMEDYKGIIIWINGHAIEKLGEVWIWEHIVGCNGLDLEQTHVLRSIVHSVLTQHPSTFDVKAHIELAPAKYYDQAERMVRFTCKILAPNIKAFHKVEEELWIGIRSLVDCKT